MRPFRLNCLGVPQVFGPDGEIIRLRTRKHLALLVILAIEPGSHRRDRLAALLWPSGTAAEGRHSLATALSVLRGRLGSRTLDATRDTVRLVSGHVVTDVDALLKDESLDTVNATPALFMADFEITNAIDFSHWVDRVRARLLPLVHDTLVRRLNHFRHMGNARQMDNIAEQLRQLDPLSEDALKAQLESRVMLGDRIGALRAFDSWRSRLGEELGAVPTKEVLRIVDRLRHDTGGRCRLSDQASHLVPPSQDGHYVGRASEFQTCCIAWETARRGQLRQLNLLGEQGIGKSSLLERVGATFALEGSSIASVTCQSSAQSMDLAVVHDLILEVASQPGASATDPRYLGYLCALNDRVRNHWPGVVPVTGQSTALYGVTLVDAVVAMLREVCEEHPLVIAIDDIDLADVASRDFLQVVARRCAALPLLLLTTSSRHASSISALPAIARKSWEPVVLHINPLTDEEAGELLAALVRDTTRPTPTICRLLLSGAHGNPSTLHILLADWLQHQNQSLALASHAMNTVTPVAVRDLNANQSHDGLRSMDGTVRTVLDLCSVRGSTSVDLTMHDIIGMSFGDMYRCLSTLLSQGILRCRGEHLAFSDSVVHGRIYRMVPPTIRRTLHSRIADRLIGEANHFTPQNGLEIALHLFRADRGDEAWAYLVEGSRWAMRIGAPFSAEIALSSARASHAGSVVPGVSIIHAECLQELGQWRESLDVLESIRHSTDSDATSLSEVLRPAAIRWVEMQSASEIDRDIDRLLDISRGSSRAAIRARAVATSARLLTLTRDSDRIAALESALGALRPDIEDSLDYLHLLLADAWCQAAGGSTVNAIACLKEGTSLADSEGIRSSVVVRLLIGLGNMLSVVGRYTEAIGPLREAESLAVSLDNQTFVAECAAQLATAFGRLGDRAAQIEWAERARERFQAHDCSAATVGANYELGLGLALGGKGAEATSVARSLLMALPPERPLWIRQGSLLCAADIMALSGHPARALRLARAALLIGEWQLLNESYSGQFARWVAQVTTLESRPSKGLTILDTHFPEPEGLHAKDRAELGASRAYLLKVTGGAVSDELNAVRERLAGLPAGISMTLRGLGLHPDQQECGT